MGNRGIVWESNTIPPKMKALPIVIDKAVDGVMQYEANAAQNDMRIHAPWDDQTGNARGGLFAQSGSENAGKGQTKFIVLYHTMPYGIWLELKQSGKYAIILPTVESHGPQVMKSINAALSALL